MKTVTVRARVSRETFDAFLVGAIRLIRTVSPTIDLAEEKRVRSELGLDPRYDFTGISTYRAVEYRCNGINGILEIIATPKL
jgi:hypothetical protein